MTKPTYEELQAQVERLREIIYCDRSATRFAEVLTIIDQHHADSLAALKAQWQAEADQYEDGMPAQKAFWEGFERGAVGRNNLNIRAHWREYVGFKTGANK